MLLQYYPKQNAMTFHVIILAIITKNQGVCAE